MSRPGKIGVGQIQGLQHGGGACHDPGGVRGVGILAADSQGGEGGLRVEGRHYVSPARDGQFVRAEVKPFCASISRLAMVPMGGSCT